LIAPVRFRSVASGLIIEKVRSFAMISPRKAVVGDCGAYIGAVTGRQATEPNAAARRIGWFGRRLNAIS
jgi:hypothetical protein